MCKDCGCSTPAARLDESPAHEQDAHHSPGHRQGVGPSATTLRLEQAILERNDRLAQRNRGWLAQRRALALNLVSSPGAGKTALLERTVRVLGREFPFRVIEGDQATEHDAERIKAAGCPALQINTGTGGHRDAKMIAAGLEARDPPAGSIVMIENVGTLVCPALFDLGEHAKVVICSVPEGDDKPVKYPHMFRAGAVLLLNKI